MTHAVIGKKASRSFAKDYQCIRDKSKLYPGEWIAIKDGELVGHQKLRKDLQQELKDSLKDVLFFKVED